MSGGEGLSRRVAGGDVDLWIIADGFDDLLLLGPESGSEDAGAEEGGVGLDLGREGAFAVVGEGVYASIVGWPASLMTTTEG